MWETLVYYVLFELNRRIELELFGPNDLAKFKILWEDACSWKWLLQNHGFASAHQILSSKTKHSWWKLFSKKKIEKLENVSTKSRNYEKSSRQKVNFLYWIKLYRAPFEHVKLKTISQTMNSITQHDGWWDWEIRTTGTDIARRICTTWYFEKGVKCWFV